MKSNHPHKIYSDMFLRAFASKNFDDFFVISLDQTTNKKNKLLRFFLFTISLRKAIKQCYKFNYMKKKFIILEFQAWSLLLLLPYVVLSRKFIGYNINHNLVKISSRLIVRFLSRFIRFYYLSGEDDFVLLPNNVKVLNIQDTYTNSTSYIKQPLRTNKILLVYPKRNDQYLLGDLCELSNSLCDNGFEMINPQFNYQNRLDYKEYKEALLMCNVLILTYHQGFGIARHSGVIWDSIYNLVPNIYIPDTLSFRNQIGSYKDSNIIFYNKYEDVILSLTNLFN